jgi:hypothetical protein
MYQNPDTLVLIPVSIISPYRDDTDTNSPAKSCNSRVRSARPTGADSFHS